MKTKIANFLEIMFIIIWSLATIVTLRILLTDFTWFIHFTFTVREAVVSDGFWTDAAKYFILILNLMFYIGWIYCTIDNAIKEKTKCKPKTRK